MAPPLKPDALNDPKHNIKAKNACIVDGFKKRLAKEKEIAKEEEKHIKPLKDDLKKIKRDMKTDTEIDGIDLDNDFRKYKRQELAKELEEDDAGRIADNMRILHDALAEGGQLDFIDAINETPNKKTA